mmetsp:Transcript_33846/g.73155  ORF Transcript_33846/g.73155 Transcript_33846/m.73155 type:complete len:221 (-) Transcript_33846:115-777(-)
MASSINFLALSTQSCSPLMRTVRSPALPPSFSVLEISMRAPDSVESCFTTSPPRPMSIPTNSAPMVITTGFATTAVLAALAPASLEPGKAALGTGPDGGAEGWKPGGSKGKPGGGRPGNPKGAGTKPTPGTIIKGGAPIPGKGGMTPGTVPAVTGVAVFSSSSGAETSLTSDNGLMASSCGSALVFLAPPDTSLTGLAASGSAFTAACGAVLGSARPTSR